MKLSKLIGNVKKFDYKKTLDDCFVETEQELLDILRSQLLDHRTGTGQLPVYKNVTYAKKKGTSRVDLKLTGSFQSKLFVTQNKYSIRIRSTDKKKDVLVKRYGVSIYELDAESYEKYVIGIVLPLLKTKMRNELLS